LPGKRIAAVQSNYIPWKGYFDLIGSVDEFVLYDDVQYSKGSWRNRNRIKTPNGVIWLTIPVSVSLGDLIKDVKIADPRWAQDHWNRLAISYSGAPCFEEMAEAIRRLYDNPPSLFLTDVNRAFIERICLALGIGTKLSHSVDYQLAGDRNQRLVDLCLKAGATEYVSGPAAECYLDNALFRENGIAVTFFQYEGYLAYSQVFPPFTHEVSVLDLLFHLGKRAGDFMRHDRRLVGHSGVGSHGRGDRHISQRTSERL